MICVVITRFSGRNMLTAEDVGGFTFEVFYYCSVSMLVRTCVRGHLSLMCFYLNEQIELKVTLSVAISILITALTLLIIR